MCGAVTLNTAPCGLIPRQVVDYLNHCGDYPRYPACDFYNCQNFASFLLAFFHTFPPFFLYLDEEFFRFPLSLYLYILYNLLLLLSIENCKIFYKIKVYIVIKVNYNIQIKNNKLTKLIVNVIIQSKKRGRQNG